MLRTTRRVLAGPLVAVAIGVGLVVAPSAAQAATATGVIEVSGKLALRTGPTGAASIAGVLGDNDRIAIACVVSGESVAGTIRTTAIWDRLTDGRYVPHAYVRAIGVLRRCETGAPEAVAVRAKPAAKATAPKVIKGVVTSNDGAVNRRSGPTTSSAIVGTVANAAKVSQLCGVVGSSVAGTVRTTTQWNRLTDGTYISHAYVRTPTLHLCKDAAEVPTSNLSNAQFIKAAVPGAQRGWREFGVPPSVTIAQAILESGWGRSRLSRQGRNYFGIKCFNGARGSYASSCKSYPTQECTKAGACFNTTATFRHYPSMTNSFRDHGKFLRVNSRYAPAFAHTKNANKFIWKVWKAGYATDPNYYTKITGIMSAHNLYRYDTWK